MNPAAWFETFRRDTRYAVRQFAGSPLFTLVAVMTLAVGIGANTAIFSLLHSILLRELPVREAGRFVILTDPSSAGVSVGASGGNRGLLSYEEFERIKAGSQSFDMMFASESSTTAVQVSWNGLPAEPLQERIVTSEYFQVLGATPAMGRFFGATEERGPGSMPYAVVSYNFWRNRLGAALTAVGSPLRIQGQPFTIVAVAREGFQGENAGVQPDLWLPAMMQPQIMAGRNWLRDDRARAPEKVMWLHVFGRLKPGVTMTQAQTELNVTFRRILEDSYAGLSAEARKQLEEQQLKIAPGSKGASAVRGDFGDMLWILLAIVGLVLLIACANIANLLLARSTARKREISIRLAMGAGRGRLIRQLLTESLLLGVAGATCGVLLAIASNGALIRLLSVPVGVAGVVDVPVLGFTLAITLVTVLLFGLAPAIRGTRGESGEGLKEEARGNASSRGSAAVARGLVAAQVSISLLLLFCAGLFLRTLDNLQKVKLGYKKEGLAVVRVDGLSAGVPQARLSDLYRNLGARIKRVPGVQGVTWSENGLFTGTESGDEIRVEGFTPQKPQDRSSRWDQVGAGYFGTIGIPILLGRDISERDVEGAPLVCVVNDAFARKFIPDGKPLGKHITNLFDEKNQPTFEIVGVAANARDHGLRREVPPRFYIAIQGAMETSQSINFEIRTAGSPGALMNAIRGAIQARAEGIQILRARTLEENLTRATSSDSLLAKLSGAFGGVALLLAAIGLYGVLAYGVVRRTNEIGIRMALGARSMQIVSMILKESGVMLGVGVVAGVVVALWAQNLIQSRLYGVTGIDPWIVIPAVGTLGLVALAAACIPAWRAARINPVSALRHD